MGHQLAQSLRVLLGQLANLAGVDAKIKWPGRLTDRLRYVHRLRPPPGDESDLGARRWAAGRTAVDQKPSADQGSA